MIISSNWFNSKYEAWREFNLEYGWKFKEIEAVIIEDNGKFRIEGVVCPKNT